MSERGYVRVNLKKAVADRLTACVGAVTALSGERAAKSEVLEALLAVAEAHPEEFQKEVAGAMGRRVDRRMSEHREVA